ncbi:Transcription elongation factor 1-like protein, partial [Mucuna pruriens]
MGKRKASSKPAPKKRMDKLDTVFSCPFCNHGTGVECRVDMKNLIGEASCRICQESFSTTVTGTINSPGIQLNTDDDPLRLVLSIIRYSEWIDECARYYVLVAYVILKVPGSFFLWKSPGESGLT